MGELTGVLMGSSGPELKELILVLLLWILKPGLWVFRPFTGGAICRGLAFSPQLFKHVISYSSLKFFFSFPVFLKD